MRHVRLREHAGGHEQPRGYEGRDEKGAEFHAAIVRAAHVRRVNAALEDYTSRPISSSLVPAGSSKKTAG